MKRVADWQIEHLRDDYHARKNPKNNNLDAWTYGGLNVDMTRWAAISGNDTYYITGSAKSWSGIWPSACITQTI